MTSPHDGPVDAAPTQSKLASKVADRIIDEIARGGWQVGSVVGSENELLDRYGISRAIFREAVRLLEHVGIATTRRGPGGGLVVTEPSTAAVIQAFLVYLTHTGMSLEELLDARVSLESSIVRLAAERADEVHIALLRDRVVEDRARDRLDAAEHHVLHTMIARSACNPAAELFADVLGRMTARWSYPRTGRRERSEALEASAHAHEQLVHAIAAGDAGLAEQRMRRHLGALAGWLGSHRLSPASLDWVLDPDVPETKLGSRIARRLIVEVVDRDWPVGEILGSETDLIERYEVSRSTLREAVRLLEYHGVASMKRGPGGGLIVTAPSIEPIVRAATVFLEYRNITGTDLLELRRNLECHAISLVADRASESDLTRLDDALRHDAAAGFAAAVDEELHVTIADLTGNAAIALFVRVLAQMTRGHVRLPEAPGGRRSGGRREIEHETDRAHRSLVEAIRLHDPALARRRMAKHLAALEQFVR